ncbi:MAG TPA: CocE/NonD family hydrolase, partial [Pseudonocardiaceae bacterium]|nr:CocE/NonD family hydrolase [Pseudonocardiaceae bacterium]
DWVAHSDTSDPFWARYQLGAALDRVQVPVLLQSGWQDLFLRQSLAQYEHLRARGSEVALTVGPWTHVGVLMAGSRVLVPESLQWLDQHLGRRGTTPRVSPVRVHVTGAGEWRDAPSWPPVGVDTSLYPHPGGGLTDRPAPTGASPARFTYDPADPTPTVGGRLLSSSLGGYKKDDALAERPDVLTFTGEALAEPLEVQGTPVAEVAHSSDNPHVDLFVRISEVDAKGRSRNISDGFVRLGPGDDGPLRIEMDPIAHRFSAGSRVRLLIAGGSFPRFDRNLGTGEDPATGTRTAVSHRSIDLAGSRVVLPVVR